MSVDVTGILVCMPVLAYLLSLTSFKKNKMLQKQVNTSILLGIIYLFFFCEATTIQAQDPPLRTRLDQQTLSNLSTDIVPEMMEAANIPGLQIAYIHQGKLEYLHAFGIKDADTGENLDDYTIFEAASLSKPVFAFLVLNLVEDSLLELDKPLFKYLPYPDAAADERYKKITARMVLTHTSGLPNWRRGKELTINFEPGTQFGYSGEGFEYLRKVVEHLTGKPIHELIDEKIFIPFQMKHSSFVWNDGFKENYALPHNKFGTATSKNKPTEGNAAASMHTTAKDYSLFLLAIFNNAGLEKELFSEMFSTQTQLIDRQSPTGDFFKNVSWGLGWGLEQTPDGTAFWHGGNNGGFKCFVMAYREQKTGVVFFTNSQNGHALVPELIRQTMGGTHPALTNYANFETYDSPPFKLFRALQQKDFKKAVRPFLNKEHLLDTEKVSEAEVNRIGYDFLQNGQVETAKRIFALNVKSFPESFNVYDSYAEACLVNGERDLAAKYYGLSLEKNARNANGQHFLEQLQPNEEVVFNKEFFLKGYEHAKLVTLAGDFNGWNKRHTIFTRAKGEWVCRVQLPPGKHHYLFVVDGVRILDVENEQSAYKGGNWTSVIEVEE